MSILSLARVREGKGISHPLSLILVDDLVLPAHTRASDKCDKENSAGITPRGAARCIAMCDMHGVVPRHVVKDARGGCTAWTIGGARCAGLDVLDGAFSTSVTDFGFTVHQRAAHKYAAALAHHSRARRYNSPHGGARITGAMQRVRRATRRWRTSH